jgi:hypothetical protein
MLYFKLKDGVVTSVHEEYTPENTISRWDFECFEQAMLIAIQAETATGNAYLPIDNGENVSPRYDVIEAPKVGDKVSCGLNGDYYPEGEIVKISDSYKIITTSTGKKFYRKGLTGRWVRSKMWVLVAGHHDRKNPSF